MLEECKNYCNYLICAIQVDPSIDRPKKNKPIQSIFERFIQLDAVKYVDKIIPYVTESELETIFESLKLDVRIIGEDYINKDFTAKNICKNRNIKIIYNKRDHKFSSTNLRNKIYLEEKNKNKK
jgi:glycerol-3-phosphate cytidylyltransferase